MVSTSGTRPFSPTDPGHGADRCVRWSRRHAHPSISGQVDTASPGLMCSAVRADWLVGGFAAVTSLYFCSEVMAYAIGGYGDAGAALGVLAVVVLSCCTFATVRLAAML